MSKIKIFSVIIFLMFLVTYFVYPVNLTAESKVEEKINPVADVRLGADGITFSPKVSYSQLVLTVSTPMGEVIRKTFDPGSTPYFELSGNEGDGSFTYELLVIPFSTKKKRENEENAGLEITRTASDRQGPMVQSGSFYVDRGSIVTATEQAEIGIAKPLDQVIIDDLIVSGSACIGTDCVNGESFGFDTLRLKENNLRIKFQDTSVSASFPSNDWQITANESENGGANKFSIEDIDGGRIPFTIKAGAPTNSLYVDEAGDLGLGTATPVVDVHVVNGNTPALRLEQNGSSGFTAQTWDVAGNEANFFVRDVTNSSKLPFKIVPGAPNNSLYIKSNGDIGIGTASPASPFHLVDTDSTEATFYIKDSGNAVVKFEKDGGAAGKFTARDNEVYIGSGSDHPLRLVVGSTSVVQAVSVLVNGNVGIGNNTPGYALVVGSAGTTYCDGNDWYPTSSREFKENIRDLSIGSAVKALNGLKPVRYNYKSNKEEERVGFIAEDVPELVAINGRKNLSPMDILGVLTSVVKEQQKTISELQEKIDALEKKLQSK